MSELFKKTIDQLPQILEKNAKPMMLRVVAGMQQAIAADQALENATYCGLVLKTAASVLALEFEHAIAASMAAMRRDSGTLQNSARGLSLSIEPLEPTVSTAATDFRSSTEAFDRLCAKADGLGAQGLAVSGKDVLMACVLEAFGKARVEAPEVASMLPYARRALNDELLRLYAKLDAL